MEIKGFDGKVSERNRTAPQSQTWKRIREDQKAEIKHFTTKGILTEYGKEWEGLVKKYLRTGYNEPEVRHEVEYAGKKYKVLKRTGITAFYDADGNTLFDITYERLGKDYEEMLEEKVESRDAKNGINKVMKRHTKKGKNDIEGQMDIFSLIGI